MNGIKQTPEILRAAVLKSVEYSTMLNPTDLGLLPFNYVSNAALIQHCYMDLIYQMLARGKNMKFSNGFMN